MVLPAGAAFHRAPFTGREPFADRAVLLGRAPFVGRGLELRTSALRRATRPFDEVCACLRSRECVTVRLRWRRSRFAAGDDVRFAGIRGVAGLRRVQLYRGRWLGR